ncbi:unnamed protein product [Discosporangium mesarthrocarpum]
MGMFLCYVGGMSYLMVKLFGRPPSEIGLYLVFLSGSFMLGTFLSTRITHYFGGIDGMIRRASVLVALCSLGVPAALYWWPETPLAFFAPALGMGLFHGLAMPNAQAGAVSVKPEVAGSASGLMMFIQIGIGSAFAQAAGVVPHDTPWPLAIMILISAFLAVAGYNLLIGRQPPADQAA